MFSPQVYLIFNHWFLSTCHWWMSCFNNRVHTVIGCSFLKFPPNKRFFNGVMGINSTLQNLVTSIFWFGFSDVTDIRSAF